MATMDDYLEVNRLNWDERAAVHAASAEYGFDRYVTDPGHLSDVVRFDRPLLGDVTGLTGIHLQCHIGTDTLSLARLGARMTGLDFSAPALAVARQLAADTGTTIDYVEAELYGAVEALGSERFDLVYTGIGALCWLPSIARWAAVVAGLVRPGGRLFIREGHPMLWTMDDPRADGLLVVRYPYFEVPGGTHFHEEVTYVDHDEPLASPATIQFNHGLGEIVTALAAAGMHLTMLVEHDSVPWNPLGDLMEVGPDEEWRLREGRERLALTYTLQAIKG